MLKWLAAIWFWHLALALAPIPPENYYNSGLRLYAAGAYSSAEKLFARAAQAGSRLQPQSFYNAGNAAYSQGRYQAALSYFEKAVAVNASDEDAWHNLELARRMAGATAGQPALALDQPAAKTSQSHLPAPGQQVPGQSGQVERVRADTAMTPGLADQILEQARSQEQQGRHSESTDLGTQAGGKDIFSQSPEEILQSMRELTRVSYPFTPGKYQETQAEAEEDEDW